MKEIDAELTRLLALRSMLASIGTSEHRATLDKALTEASKVWLVNKAEIISYCRLRYIVDARQSVMVALYLDFSFKSKLTGSLLARDHGTVLFAVKAVEAKWTTDPEFRRKFSEFRSRLGLKQWILRPETRPAIENAQ